MKKEGKSALNTVCNVLIVLMILGCIAVNAFLILISNNLLAGFSSVSVYKNEAVATIVSLDVAMTVPGETHVHMSHHDGSTNISQTQDPPRDCIGVEVEFTDANGNLVKGKLPDVYCLSVGDTVNIRYNTGEDICYLVNVASLKNGSFRVVTETAISTGVPV